MTSHLVGAARNAGLRWHCMVHLDGERPGRTTDAALLTVMQAIYPDTTLHELRRHLDYLADRKLLKISPRRKVWRLRLKWRGIDVVEYTSACPAGIARPSLEN